jgi:hypothetical protein
MGPHGSAWWPWVTPSHGCRTRHHRAPCAEETVHRPRSHDLTRLDVVQAVRAVAVDDEETTATMIHLIRSGQVRLGDDAITAMMDVLASVNAAA